MKFFVKKGMRKKNVGRDEKCKKSEGDEKFSFCGCEKTDFLIKTIVRHLLLIASSLLAIFYCGKFR
jgi:hypothetical protein